MDPMPTGTTPPLVTDIVPHSPRLSFRGWALTVWLAKNKEFVKLILTGLGTYASAAQMFDVGSLLELAYAVLGAAFVLGLKLALDAVDYYFTEDPE